MWFVSITCPVDLIPGNPEAVFIPVEEIIFPSWPIKTHHRMESRDPVNFL